MKNINTIITLCVAGFIAIWILHTANVQNTYVLGRNRFDQAGYRKPKLLRDIQSFFTLSDDPNPYSALDDLLASDLKNTRVAFLLGSSTLDSKESPAFYEELTHAIQTANKTKFEQTIDKYAIDFVVYDPQPSDTDKRMLAKTKQMLVDSDIMSLYRKWDTFAIYDTERPVRTSGYLTLTTTLPNIGPTENEKAAIHSYGDVGYYMSDDSRPYNKYFPFIDLATNTTLSNKEWQLDDDGKYLYFSRTLKGYASSYNLSKNKTQEEIIFSNGDKLNVDEDLVKTMIHKDALIAYFNKQPIAQLSTAKVPVKNCGWVKGSVTWSKKGGELAVTAKQLGVGCFSFDTAGLKGDQQYLIQVASEHTDGAPLGLTVENLTTRKAVLTTSLENDTTYLALDPQHEGSVRYRFRFRNESDQNFSSSNILKSITVYAFPYEEVESIVLTSKETPYTRAQTVAPTASQRFGSYMYMYDIAASQTPYTTIAFMHPYMPTISAYTVKATQPRWLTYIAPYLAGKRLDQRVLVNSWANGWTMPKPTTGSTIVVLNWPRYIFIVMAIIFCAGVFIYHIVRGASALSKRLLKLV